MEEQKNIIKSQTHKTAEFRHKAEIYSSNIKQVSILSGDAKRSKQILTTIFCKKIESPQQTYDGMNVVNANVMTTFIFRYDSTISIFGKQGIHIVVINRLYKVSTWYQKDDFKRYVYCDCTFLGDVSLEVNN